MVAARLQVVVLEATSKTLTKVKISGGGRCNVLHDTSKSTSELLQGYPRGKKELTGLLTSRFTPQQARQWFEQHGVALKTESDGRMFPMTDSSQTVMDALLEAADSRIVGIQMRHKVTSVKRSETSAGFQVSYQQSASGTKQQLQEHFDAVILATGSAPAGYQLAQSLLEPSRFVSPVPSLFTLNTKLDVKEEGCLLYGLAGVSVPNAQVFFRPPPQSPDNDDNTPPTPKKRRTKKAAMLQQEGPLLVTHHGVSGPAVLRLSAFGAREFHQANYRGALLVHWAPSLGTTDEIAQALWMVTQTNPKRAVATSCPLSIPVQQGKGDAAAAATKNAVMAAIPKRLWASMVTTRCDIDPATPWGAMSKKAVRKLACQIAECSLEITGKGTFKDEFVTAGGVSLKAIDMKSMMAKPCPGLFLCGEVINVDGVTGGFNFMNCWSTGHVAGTSAVDYVLGTSAVE